MGAVSLTRNSSAELQEILCIGDPDVASSLGVARVLASAPASTAAALAVRVVSGPSSVADFSVRAVSPSTAADNLRTVYQSTAADLNVTVAGYSTTVNVSSLAGAVIVRSTAANLLASVYQSTAADLNVTVAGYSTIATVSTGSVRVHQSTAADLNVTVAGYSTTVQVSSVGGAVVTRINTSSGGSVEGSTTTPAAGALGLHVRPCFPTLLSTTVNVTSTNSSAFYMLIEAAGAGLKNKVFAYFVGSTHTIPSTGEFINSTTAPKWAVNFGSGSSGITGANLAVSPPAYLFETAANTSLTFRVAGNSSAAATTVLRVSISWFAEA